MPFRRNLVLVLCGVAAGCGAEAGLPDTATREGERVGEFWDVLLIAGTAVTVLVLGLLALVVIRDRRRGRVDLPVQSRGHVGLEIGYTAGAAVLSAGIFGLGLWYQADVDDDPPADLVLDAQGFQWGWRFVYPDGEVVRSTPDRDPVVVLPVDSTVTFRLVSEDVIHSFFVPGFAWKQDLIPGRPNDLTVTTTEQGEYVGHCAEFCGLDHARMNFVVRIVGPDEFAAWLEEQPPA